MAKNLIDVAAETATGLYGPIKRVAELERRTVTRGGRAARQVTRVSTLYARWGPWASLDAPREGVIVGTLEYNVWVHVRVWYSDGQGSHDHRPNMHPNVGTDTKWDWMGRFRCDIFFLACGDDKIWLHRVAAFVWGNTLQLSWAAFTARVPGAHRKRYVYEADHTNGDCYIVRHDKCETVTPSVNQTRDNMRRDLQQIYLDHFAKVKFDTMIRKLPSAQKPEMRKLRDLFERHLGVG